MNPKVKIIQSEDEIPKGSVQIHLYDWKDVMRPRGPMKKESLGEYILERFKSNFEHWTDPKYGDNPDVLHLISMIYNNALEELNCAWSEFINTTGAEKILNKELKKLLTGAEDKNDKGASPKT